MCFSGEIFLQIRGEGGTPSFGTLALEGGSKGSEKIALSVWDGFDG